MANKSNKKKLKISLSEQPDIFNQLEEAMQPVFETNHVAALGFLAIKDSGWLEQVLGSKFEGGIDMGSDLYLVPEESPTGKQMGLAEGQFWHKGIGQRQKIYVKQKGDNPLRFINMSALEYNSFVHELMHLGHMVLKDLLRENTSGIPELTTTRDPKIINMVGSAMDKDAAEFFYKGDSWVESYRNFPEKKQDLWKRKGLGPPYMIKAEQYPNEVANIIARLYSGEDGKMLTENLTFMNAYDSTRSAINPKTGKRMFPSTDRFPKEDLVSVNLSEYGGGIKTTAGYTSQGEPSMGFYGKWRPRNPKKILERGVTDGKYMGDNWGIETYDTADFYPSDKHFIQDLRRQNKLLNAVSKKVLDKIKELPPREHVYEGQAEQPFISEKPNWWQKAVDFVINKPADAIGGVIDALPFNKGGQVKSLDDQMKALKVG